ncbi:putative antiviral helicase [Monocercomonoides exilis]|uniref:putative antiviral helicase n=1 Tax=Monocercomonoides exilis TaxID=2049356 RepID=UPI00355A471A|nr:putative antiviral helicase [Monocercomonoides exilis]|eukprot:MONOS_6208.1-p1 / transcript=MONOS_6208.1 / gene=MONOS_6208 / organism=Monocercomonoides_exilis_PA203 / gene_product=Chain A, Crystal Structure Of The S. Cerevisiae Dexh Helicase Ski2 Bound To Amppnp / transcript_product=Chain A, Crystal Structure Of The S. Cerevisiae Dexh Helicase Ski2 Bound To Amppnp / location=Mono_scaffold00192:73677-81874(-) / protein_length=2632 / sequence_SO=supercontig / SO=protein_coding / is_pseudo=false
MSTEQLFYPDSHESIDNAMFQSLFNLDASIESICEHTMTSDECSFGMDHHFLKTEGEHLDNDFLFPILSDPEELSLSKAFPREMLEQTVQAVQSSITQKHKVLTNQRVLSTSSNSEYGGTRIAEGEHMFMPRFSLVNSSVPDKDIVALIDYIQKGDSTPFEQAIQKSSATKRRSVSPSPQVEYQENEKRIEKQVPSILIDSSPSSNQQSISDSENMQSVEELTEQRKDDSAQQNDEIRPPSPEFMPLPLKLIPPKTTKKTTENDAKQETENVSKFEHQKVNLAVKADFPSLQQSSRKMSRSPPPRKQSRSPPPQAQEMTQSPQEKQQASLSPRRTSTSPPPLPSEKLKQKGAVSLNDVVFSSKKPSSSSSFRYIPQNKAKKQENSDKQPLSPLVMMPLPLNSPDSAASSMSSKSMAAEEKKPKRNTWKKERTGKQTEKGADFKNLNSTASESSPNDNERSMNSLLPDPTSSAASAAHVSQPSTSTLALSQHAAFPPPPSIIARQTSKASSPSNSTSSPNTPQAQSSDYLLPTPSTTSSSSPSSSHSSSPSSSSSTSSSSAKVHLPVSYLFRPYLPMRGLISSNDESTSQSGKEDKNSPNEAKLLDELFGADVLEQKKKQERQKASQLMGEEDAEFDELDEKDVPNDVQQKEQQRCLYLTHRVWLTAAEKKRLKKKMDNFEKTELRKNTKKSKTHHKDTESAGMFKLAPFLLDNRRGSIGTVDRKYLVKREKTLVSMAAEDKLVSLPAVLQNPALFSCNDDAVGVKGVGKEIELAQQTAAALSKKANTYSKKGKQDCKSDGFELSEDESENVGMKLLDMLVKKAADKPDDKQTPQKVQSKSNKPKKQQSEGEQEGKEEDNDESSTTSSSEETDELSKDAEDEDNQNELSQNDEELYNAKEESELTTAEIYSRFYRGLFGTEEKRDRHFEEQRERKLREEMAQTLAKERSRNGFGKKSKGDQSSLNQPLQKPAKKERLPKKPKNKTQYSQDGAIVLVNTEETNENEEKDEKEEKEENELQQKEEEQIKKEKEEEAKENVIKLTPSKDLNNEEEEEERKKKAKEKQALKEKKEALKKKKEEEEAKQKQSIEVKTDKLLSDCASSAMSSAEHPVGVSDEDLLFLSDSLATSLSLVPPHPIDAITQPNLSQVKADSQQQMALQPFNDIHNKTKDPEDWIKMMLFDDSASGGNISLGLPQPSPLTDNHFLSPFTHSGALIPFSLHPVLSTLLSSSATASLSAAPGDISNSVLQYAFLDETETQNTFAQQLPHPAIVFPFQLDPFQQRAILHIERGDAFVFVDAHTSAGKSVVAEYAIAVSLKNKTRAIYTSPIKTLSNQKFRDLRQTFGNDEVGILTGDVCINPKANILVMTTEILRTMLYSGSETLTDAEWIIFDEVHYINDFERGVVWEECIIMLPPSVKAVFLSATVPNAMEFAEWVGRTKKKPVAVIRTDFRPVPLTHFAYPGSGDKLYLVMDQNKRFFGANFQTAVAQASKNGGGGGGGGGGGRGGGRGSSASPAFSSPYSPANKGGGRDSPSSSQSKSNRKGGNSSKFFSKFANASQQNFQLKREWKPLVELLHKNNLLPAIAFVFSKQGCTDSGMALMSEMDLTTPKEKELIEYSYKTNVLDGMTDAEKEIEQVVMMEEFLKRGIGVHHAGILPVVKECVELLFASGHVKILFATETLAMGVNLPARCVIFRSVKKFDSKQMRYLRPGEYTQMSGRAGRRGIDKVGTVIINMFKDSSMDQQSMEEIMKGAATRLQSKFHLSFRMALNAMRSSSATFEEGELEKEEEEDRKQKEMRRMMRLEAKREERRLLKAKREEARELERKKKEEEAKSKEDKHTNEDKDEKEDDEKTKDDKEEELSDDDIDTENISEELSQDEDEEAQKYKHIAKIIKKSFVEFHSNEARPFLEEKLNGMKQKLRSLPFPVCSSSPEEETAMSAYGSRSSTFSYKPKKKPQKQQLQQPPEDLCTLTSSSVFESSHIFHQLSLLLDFLFNMRIVSSMLVSLSVSRSLAESAGVALRIGRMVFISTEECPFCIGVLVESSLKQIRQRLQANKARKAFEKITNQMNKQEAGAATSTPSYLSLQSYSTTTSSIALPSFSQTHSPSSYFSLGSPSGASACYRDITAADLDENEERIAVLALIPPPSFAFTPLGCGGEVNETVYLGGDEEREGINGCSDELSFSDTRTWQRALLFIYPRHIVSFSEELLQINMKLTPPSSRHPLSIPILSANPTSLLSDWMDPTPVTFPKSFSSPNSSSVPSASVASRTLVASPASVILDSLCDYCNGHQPFCSKRVFPQLTVRILSDPDRCVVRSLSNGLTFCSAARSASQAFIRMEMEQFDESKWVGDKVCSQTGVHYRQAIDILKGIDRMEQYQRERDKSDSVLLEELHQLIIILQRGKYITSEGILTLKGRAACEADVGDCVLLSEVIFANFFAGLTAADAMSALSAFVCSEKGFWKGTSLRSSSASASDGQSGDWLGERLSWLTQRLETASYNWARLKLNEPVNYDLSIPPDPQLVQQYLYTPADEFSPPALNTALMGVVLKWAEGSEFSEACQYSTSGNMADQPIMEGAVLRCILRTISVADSVKRCARVLGDARLMQLMDDGVKAVHRGIVSAGSLYLKDVQTKQKP